MNKIQELFKKEFPNVTDRIIFVDPTRKSINVWDLKEIADASYFDEPLFKHIEIPKELVFSIFRRGFDAACRSLLEEVHEYQK